MNDQRWLGRRLSLVPVALILAATAALPALAARDSGAAPGSSKAASAKPGGLLGPKQIGKVALGASSAKVRAWLGSADQAWLSPAGGSTDEGPVSFTGELWGYGCAGVALRPKCQTLFGFVHGKLASFSTRSRTFRTAKGTRVGAPLKTVIAREHGSWGGWGFQCPGVVLADGSIVFVAQMDWKTRAVSGFYVSRSESGASFSACGS
ncbi:MAG: hypothetical protein ACXVZO_10705 [Gaiellaceae bacterium]